jgi:hypothetical protein
MAQREALQQAKLMLAALKQGKQLKSPPPKLLENSQDAIFVKSPTRNTGQPDDISKRSQITEKEDQNGKQGVNGSPEYNLYPNPYRHTKSLAFQRANQLNTSTSTTKQQGAVLAFTPLKRDALETSDKLQQPVASPSPVSQRRTASNRRGREPRVSSHGEYQLTSVDTSKDVYSLEEIASQNHRDKQRENRHDESDEYIYSVDNDESMQHLNGATPGKRSGQRTPQNIIPQTRTSADSRQSGEKHSSEKQEIRLTKSSFPYEESGQPQQADPNKQGKQKQDEVRTGQANQAVTVVDADDTLKQIDGKPSGASVKQDVTVSYTADLEISYSNRYPAKKPNNHLVESAYSINNLTKPKKHTHDDDYWVIKQKIKKTEAAYRHPNSPEVKLLQASFSQTERGDSRLLESEPIREISKGHRAKETGSRESEQHRKEQIEALRLALRNKRSSSSHPTILGISHESPKMIINKKKTDRTEALNKVAFDIT